jgi:hypothetical protein
MIRGPQIGSSVCVVHTTRDVLLIMAIGKDMLSSLADRNCRPRVLASGEDEVGSNIGILQEGHCNKFVILCGFRVF